MRHARWSALKSALAAVMIAVSSLATAAWAGPLDPALQVQLLRLYDSYNKAIATGKLDEAVAMRSRQAREDIRKDMGSASARKEFLEFSVDVIPDTVEVKRTTLSKDGATAAILVIARRTIPRGAPPGAPPPGTVLANEVTLNFLKEDGAWKFDSPVFGPDPTAIIHCKNEAFEPLDAYDPRDNVSMSMGGPIARVTFEKDYTLVVIRIVDEENCAYLPNRAAIAKSGLNPDLLIPYAIISIDGFPHKSDKQKIWAERFSVSGD